MTVENKGVGHLGEILHASKPGLQVVNDEVQITYPVASTYETKKLIDYLQLEPDEKIIVQTQARDGYIFVGLKNPDGSATPYMQEFLEAQATHGDEREIPRIFPEQPAYVNAINQSLYFVKNPFVFTQHRHILDTQTTTLEGVVRVLSQSDNT